MKEIKTCRKVITKKLCIGFIAFMVISFTVLLCFGREIYKQSPHVPVKEISPDGMVVFNGQSINNGRM